jgi:two-component system response regulator BaeR
MKQMILVVEDEPKLAGVLRDYLRQAEFKTFWIANASAVVPWVQKHAPALILLDLMLPGGYGLDICREIRTYSTVPIIMITARIEEIDRLLGLESGADDYICKPFSPREVVARVRAVLRRTEGNPSTDTAAGLALDQTRYQATLNGHDLGLTAVEFRLLQFFSSKKGQVCTRQQLMDNIYSDERVVADRTIDSHVMHLRIKIALVDANAEFIHSVYGVGYKFELREKMES